MEEVTKMFCGGCPTPVEFSEVGGRGGGCDGPVETVAEGAGRLSTLHSVVRYQQATDKFPPGRYCGRKYEADQASNNEVAEAWASIRVAAEDTTIIELLSGSYGLIQDTRVSVVRIMGGSVQPEAEQIPAALVGATTNLDEALAKESMVNQCLNSYLQTSAYSRNPPSANPTHFDTLATRMDEAKSNPQNTVSIGMVAAELHAEALSLSKVIGNIMAVQSIVSYRKTWLSHVGRRVNSHHIDDAVNLINPYLEAISEAEEYSKLAFDKVINYRP